MPRDPQVATMGQIPTTRMDCQVEMTLGRGKAKEGADPEGDSQTEVIRVPPVRTEKTRPCVWRLRRATRGEREKIFSIDFQSLLKTHDSFV